jgi:hypothetical protein
MKAQLKSITALILTGFIASPALAASNQSLEASVASLEKQVAALKTQVNLNTNKITHTRAKPTKIGAGGAAFSDEDNVQYLPFDPDAPGKAYVTTGPYVGVNIQFAGSNLIINSPSVNTDLQLLDIRKKILKQLNDLGTAVTNSDHSHLLFSGVIETQAGATKREGHRHSSSDIDVTNVSLDATIFGPSDWILGYIEFSYDGGSAFESVYQSRSHYRTANSRVFVNKAFVTLGNLSCSPFYATFGQFYVPFGTYSTVMISEPLTKLLGRTKARAVELGFQQQAKSYWYGSVYTFRGDSHVGSVSGINNGGINLGYKFNGDKVSASLGGGVIANIADSGGMQFGANFQDFERLVHRVPAYDLRATLSISEHIDFLAEYVTASTRFNPNDLSFNNHGAKPRAFDIQGAYSFPLFDNKPSSIGIGYGASSQTAGMFMPLTRRYIVFNTSLLRNTLQSIEIRRDLEYAASDVATNANGFVVPPQSGKSNTGITAQFDYYF